MEFQKQSEIMNMKEETMEETSAIQITTVHIQLTLTLVVDDMWSDEEEEAATDDVLNQVRPPTFW